MERIGRANIVGYEQELLGYATRTLKAVAGPRLVDTAPDKAAILSFVLDGYRPEDVGSALEANGITVRAGTTDRSVKDLDMNERNVALWPPPGPTLGRSGPAGQARLRLSISRRIIGVKISCMASSILPPGTTMLLGRDMNESCSIDSR